MVMALNLLPKGARSGELEVCESDLTGACLLNPPVGGLRMMFCLDAAFLLDRRGDIFRDLIGLMDGIGA